MPPEPDNPNRESERAIRQAATRAASEAVAHYVATNEEANEFYEFWGGGLIDWPS